ncbi:hypothetical protein JQ607_14110 [Bradyrhizobium liaoningense]|uniref:hypothetical protein n=1 Tax=Bradyrhizobium liaoningense TaxID=43992 RepID=UPI001BAB1FD2|nr:hypothetical protein [Bradyrhizobium liaoningense]MBR0841328.1 hypothetical protein [Bradyrhizobium liaoningense]
MSGVAEPILQTKLVDLQAQARRTWNGLEREAIIEIVRSADYAAYIIHCASEAENSLDEAARDELRLILLGVAPALATFLPLMKGGRGLPFGPATPQTARWIDQMLFEFGTLARMQRFAALERYGLARSEMVDAATIRMEMQAGVGELMDVHAGRWLTAETKRSVALMQGPPPDNAYIEGLLDATSGVHDGWFIRYEGHPDISEAHQQRAVMDVLGCIEAEALPREAMIGGRPFAEWRAVCISALERVYNHVAYASRLMTQFPGLSIRNLLTVPVLQKDARAVWIEAGDRPQYASDTISHLALDAQSIGPWQHHHEIPAPFYVDVGGGWYLLSLFGGLLNPVCGLVRTLRLRHTRDWDKAVDRREIYFREDLRNHFGEPRFHVPDHGMTLRREDGSHITDVDAAILDRETGSLALLQLKWPDIYGMSPKERESRRLNLLKANEWVDRVASWIAGRSARQVAKALGMPDGASESKPPILMVIPRYAARFTLNDRLDDRACWVAWPEVARMRIENKEAEAPLSELQREFKSGGSLPPYNRPEDFTYKLRGLDVCVSVL